MNTDGGTRRLPYVILVLLVAVGLLVPVGSARAAADCRLAGDATQRIAVEMDDGVVLDGWLALPECPSSAPFPVVVSTGPYFGECWYLSESACDITPDNAEWWTDAPPKTATENTLGFPPIELVEAGYALVYVSDRGTGRSGGCFELLGDREQRDQAEIVRWAAHEPWSNRRVGMAGLSYGAGTALAAASFAPRELKTVVMAGLVTDLYTLTHSPQGATDLGTPAVETLLYAPSTFVPPAGEAHSGGDPERAASWAELLPERTCPEVREALTTEYVGVARGATPEAVRNGAFYDERRLIDGVGDTRTSMLMAVGTRDYVHRFQDDELWRAAPRAPKRLIAGDWGHVWPPGALPTPGKSSPHCSGPTQDWCTVVFEWLDYWLRGVGDRPPLGVEVQDDDGTWQSAGAWPPPAAAEEVLYLAGADMRSTAARGDRTFVSAPPGVDHHVVREGAQALDASASGPDIALCADHLGMPDPTSAVYETEPMAADVDVIGNPFAYLDLTARPEAGQVNVWVVSKPSEFSCDGLGSSGYQLIARGAADLRFHAGTFDARPFGSDDGAGGRRGHVRVDLGSATAHVPANHRLVVIIGYGGTFGEYFTSDPAQLTVHAGQSEVASHVVVPVTAGSTGGATPTLTYPPRPFVPLPRD